MKIDLPEEIHTVRVFFSMVNKIFLKNPKNHAFMNHFLDL